MASQKEPQSQPATKGWQERPTPRLQSYYRAPRERALITNAHVLDISTYQSSWPVTSAGKLRLTSPVMKSTLTPTIDTDIVIDTSTILTPLTTLANHRLSTATIEATCVVSILPFCTGLASHEAAGRDQHGNNHHEQHAIAARPSSMSLRRIHLSYSFCFRATRSHRKSVPAVPTVGVSSSKEVRRSAC